MTGVVGHGKDALAAFLDRQYRQVWAVHRVTGDRVFIDWGEATPEMRAYTREHLRCPVPGCDLRISARGRSKRDHFYHLGDPGHSDGEGEWHLQAKALLTEWAASQPGVVAQEEESVAIPSTGSLRRADVMATRLDNGAKFALEVEYKEYKPEHWSAKQDDYDQVGVGCTWVFGHLPRYLRQPRKPKDFPEDETWDRLLWVELTEAVARAGRPVVFINPVERAVVTAVQHQEPLEDAQQDPHWWRRSAQVGTRLAHPDCRVDPILILDPLHECTLDPVRGLVTPTMRRVETERTHIAALAQAAREAAEAEAARQRQAAEQRRAEQQARRDERRRLAARSEEEREAARAYGEHRRAQHALDWQNHPLRARIIANRGEIPHFLDCVLPGDRAVYAHPTHWHSQLFNDLVLGTGETTRIGVTVTFSEVLLMLRKANIGLPRDARRSFEAIRDFLYHLRDHGFLSINEGGIRHIASVTVIADLKTAKPTPRSPTPTSAEEPPLPPPTGTGHRHAPLDSWENSHDRRTLLRKIGELPQVLAATTPDESTPAICVVPARWHTRLFLRYIHQPPGSTFKLSAATQHLIDQGLAQDAADLPGAVHAFFLRLQQHGCLTSRPAPALPDTAYTVLDSTL